MSIFCYIVYLVDFVNLIIYVDLVNFVYYVDLVNRFCSLFVNFVYFTKSIIEFSVK